ncbi:DUF3416 domain-containing protein [Rhizobium sp. P38BS-XIX]|uniref:alpha-1,4-glucan--maltose-1-phosphate maltosyltransferase n=1 Tax=Rhizobium sp. P38BS-XIX TaxID=2726740 RepID=UPI001456D416|nr:alpha-1,4-glucan--maltose-1-phosphate maltosyltransferase [Rhizobium sp. P38BS-XIX]NLR97198.1 DUF3416 domain-containing protein [Rhizobium sp. P38BS-XIX]
MTLASKPRLLVNYAKIYYVNPLLLAGRDQWAELFDHAVSLGFDSVLSAPVFQRSEGGSVFSTADYERLDPALGLGEDSEEGVTHLAHLAQERELGLMLDVPIQITSSTRGGLDPRRSPLALNGVSDGSSRELSEEWAARLARFTEYGVCGYRMLGLEGFSPESWRQLISAAKDVRAGTQCFAYTPGTDFALREALQGCGFDAVFSSVAWWDLRESWLLNEYRLQRSFDRQIAFPEAPFAKRIAHGLESREVRERRSRRALNVAAEFGDGLLIPMGFEFGATLPLDPLYGRAEGLRKLRADGDFDISTDLRDLNFAKAADSTKWTAIRSETMGSLTILTQADEPDLRNAEDARLVVINRDLRESRSVAEDQIARIAAPFRPNDIASVQVAPGELVVLAMTKRPAIIGAPVRLAIDDATAMPRIAIEHVSPTVDGGRFPIKRVIGNAVTIEADIFADGHDVLSAALLYRPCDESVWREARMDLTENDRWRGSFLLDRIGRFEFRVAAWKNPFAIFRYEFAKKNEARLDLHLEVIEGEDLVRQSAEHPSEIMDAEGKAELLLIASQLKDCATPQKIEMLLSGRLSELMAKADRRPFLTHSSTFGVEAERKEAAFASWYQVFPRSQSGDPERHGTFDDVVARLPAIREMGFDVLYFPPIHPIGHTNRKGRNNSLIATPADPGSPYAIGSEAGGHDAIHPLLGQFGDFERLVDQARLHGLEIALDLAIQASPDHPWLKDHPGWFDWRPDGTIRYAENPPKKYEDIVNVDFYAKDSVPALWVELRDIVDMWVEEGVRLFRVDNPHTKPFPFWEWLIGDIRARHPDVVFLSEAFTRPKVMYRLAKVGFSQSYTYFTWRNARWDLEQYMIELTQGEPKEFFRPHFFVNTHDINPDFLQNAPRPAYLIRAALAATLSGLWGVYNGFELCEGRPDAKRKEYADSEKYEIRAWDYDRPGNIKAEIAMLNRIRKDNPALQSHLGLTLLSSSNPNVMFFEKASTDRGNVLLIAVTLDPDTMQESTVEFPLWHFGLGDEGTLAFEDLVSGERFDRSGKWQQIRLDPNRLPFAIWRIRTGGV